MFCRFPCLYYFYYCFVPNTSLPVMKYFGKELKKEFQLERIIFFSDAVFAIAITLLIIDLHIPDVEIGSDADLLHALGTIIPGLFGFVISFFIIANFWDHHHSIFGYVEKYDSGLIWLNLVFLFFIVLIPFSTRIFGNFGGLLTATTIYSLNIICAGFFTYLILRHVSRPGKKLSFGLENKRLRRGFYVLTLAIPAWILICWLVGLITDPAIGDICLFGLGFVIPISKRKFGKAQKAN